MEVFKLYTDGSYNYQRQSAGIGGYLLDSKNKIIFHYHHQLKYNLYKHEKLSLYLGLLKCKRLGIRHIVCHFDDFSLQKKYNGAGQSVSKDSLDIKINKIKKYFNFIQFVFIPREDNTMADKLASLYLKAHSKNFIERKILTTKTLVIENVNWGGDNNYTPYTIFYKRFHHYGLLLLYNSEYKIIYQQRVTQNLFQHTLHALGKIYDKNISLHFAGSGEINQIIMILKQYKQFEGNRQEAEAIFKKFDNIEICNSIERYIKSHIYSSFLKSS